MSTSFIINLAFFIGLFFSYQTLKKIIKSVLNRKRQKSKVLSEDINIFEDDINAYVDKLVKEFHDLNTKVSGIINDAYNKAKNIDEDSTHRLGRELEDRINSNMKQASNKVTKATSNFKVNSTNVAADTIKQMMREYRNNKEVISSFSRDLSKKLH